MDSVNPKEITEEIRKELNKHYQQRQAALKAKRGQEKARIRCHAIRVQKRCLNFARQGKTAIYLDSPLDDLVIDYLKNKCDLILECNRRNAKGSKYTFRPAPLPDSSEESE